MFWLGFAVAVVVICVLTWIGARMAEHNPDTAWERREDRPMFGDWGD